MKTILRHRSRWYHKADKSCVKKIGCTTNKWQFPVAKLAKSASYASSAFFGQSRKIMFVTTNYAKKEIWCTGYQSLLIKINVSKTCTTSLIIVSVSTLIQQVFFFCNIATTEETIINEVWNKKYTYDNVIFPCLFCNYGNSTLTSNVVSYHWPRDLEPTEVLK